MGVEVPARQIRVAGIEGDRLDGHVFAGDDGHDGEPAGGIAGMGSLTRRTWRSG